MKIGIDLDQVLVNQTWLFKRAFAMFNRIYYCTKYYNFQDYPDEVRNLIFEWFSDNFYMSNLPVIPEAKAFLNHLKFNDHEVFIITARPKNVIATTIDYIRNNLSENIPIIFSDKDVNTKDKIVERLKLDVWIDDNPEDVVNITNLGIRCIMISNEDTVYNWKLKEKVMCVESVKFKTRIDLIIKLVEEDNLKFVN